MLVRELKAVFFVRDFIGNPARKDGQKFPTGETARPHVEVRFRDGEVMVGRRTARRTDPQGFFLVPADPESNNLRVYVVAAATRAVYPLEPVARSKARVGRCPSRPGMPGRSRRSAASEPSAQLAHAVD